MRSGIYVITCLRTDQQYVGTAIDWEKRIAQHLSKLRRGKHKNKKMQQAWIEHGPIAFEFKLVEECELPELLARERFWVEQLGSDTKGFNQAQWLGSNGSLTHGQTHSRTYKSWDAMLQRCTNENSPDYPKYGGAGISIFPAWLKFENFYADMGDRPEGTSLDRFPNNKGNYEPTNCRWATPPQQQRNIGVNQYLTVQGETKLLVNWARETKIPADLLRKRHLAGVTGLELFAASYSRFKGIKNADGQTVTTKRKLAPGKTYTAHGKTLTLPQWAAELGVGLSALNQRIHKYKIPLEEALVSGERKKGKAGPRQGHHMITAFGKTQSLTSWSREKGIPVSTLKNRLYRANMSPEDALA